jgi:hypothetical protein
MRAAVVFRYFYDLDVAATADALRCSEGTVKSQTARALDKLRAALEQSSPAARRRRHRLADLRWAAARRLPDRPVLVGPRPEQGPDDRDRRRGARTRGRFEGCGLSDAKPGRGIQAAPRLSISGS